MMKERGIMKYDQAEMNNKRELSDWKNVILNLIKAMKWRT